jgi:hypothetical protein
MNGFQLAFRMDNHEQTPGPGARLTDCRTVDEEHILIHWLDGKIEYKEDGTGPTACMGHETDGVGDKVIDYLPHLDVIAATDPASYRISSETDRDYRAPIEPLKVFRKTKVNGTDKSWPEARFTLEHTLYLRLPRKLKQGQSYTVSIGPAVNSDTSCLNFVFDVFAMVSEAIHVNLIGYHPDITAVKSADLYIWLGDGGSRDYSEYAGRKVILCDQQSGEKHETGRVKFWKKSGRDLRGKNLTAADVWNCDFSDFDRTGTFRLVIEGIGCSPEFRLSRDIYYEPFKHSIRGFFYMRIGAEKNFTPVPRQPRFIPDVDPPDFKVYRTTYGPWHPDWKKSRRDTWDTTDWSPYNEPGNPVNPDAWGGHSDACDWDRNPHHVSIIWDLLLPFLLSNGKVADDNFDIPESGNAIPDLIDEARYEVDFWLRLRDGRGGYSAGINNPDRKDHSRMYQAAARPYMAWVSAANAAMLADSFRICGRTDLMNRYAEAAREAWTIADEEDLDTTMGIGNGAARGRDLKMMAAAFLYNVTADRYYEDVMADESVVTSPFSVLDRKGKYCQYWGTAAYLMCSRFGWREIHHPNLLKRMRQAVIHEAFRKNVRNTAKRPSRRSTNDDYGWFQGTQEVQLLCIAHAAAEKRSVKDRLLRAMILESDYGLGRNPLNMVLMTGLGSRCVEDIYTSGRNDGTPGVHPGHTPYMNAEPWGKGGNFQSDPQWYASKGYPEWKHWPHGEALWKARYCYANNEFTPQQTMRGKTALLGYLYSLGDPRR